MNISFVLYLAVIWIYIIVLALACPSNSIIFSRQEQSPLLQFRSSITDTSLFTFEVFSHNNIRHLVYNTYKGALIGNAILSNCTLGPQANLVQGIVDIQLDSVSSSSNGVYRFLQKQAIYMTVIQCITLYILGVPSTSSISSNTNPYVGEDVILSCSSSHTTQPSNHSLSMRYDWQVDGVTNPTGNKYDYTTSGLRLTVKNVVKVDAQKTLICSATEVVTDGYTSFNSPSLNINVLYGPDNTRFSPASDSYEVTENDTLPHVACQADCNPPCSFKWTMGSQDVSTIHVLSLGIVQFSETGVYRCTATHTRGQTSTKDLRVNIIYGPDSTQLSPATNFYTKNEGEPLGDITCSSDCFPICTFSWRKVDGGVVSGNGVLSLATLQRNEVGAYTCTAVNPERQGQSQISPSVTVNVRYGPDESVFNVNSPFYVTEGQVDADIICLSSECWPGCRNTLYNDSSNTPIGNNGKISLGIVSRHTSGNYTCRSENTYNGYQKSSSKTLQLYVYYTPDIPTKFDFIDDSITESSVTVLWNPGFNGGLPQIFVIQYKPVSDQGQWTSVEIPEESGGIILFTLTNLYSDTEYTARMFAYNAVNRTDFTAEIIFNTTVDTHSDDPSPTNIALIGGIVGGCGGVAMVITGAVAFLLIRKRRLGVPKNTSNESEASAYTELNVTRSASTVYDPIQTCGSLEQAGGRTESSKVCTDTGLAQYENIEKTPELGNTDSNEQIPSNVYANA